MYGVDSINYFPEQSEVIEMTWLVLLLTFGAVLAAIVSERPLSENPKFYAWVCTGIAVSVSIVFSEIDKINPSLTIPLAIIGSIAACIAMVIFTVEIIMTITNWRMNRRTRKQQEQRLREETNSEDFKRFVDEDLGLIIIIDEAAGKMRILEKIENDNEMQKSEVREE